MDIDRFIAKHQGEWSRLDELTTRGRRKISNLDASELDELLRLYQKASAHLSVVRTRFDDVALSNRLSITIGNARGLIYRKRSRGFGVISTFFTSTLPAAAWSCRRAIAVGLALTFLPAIALGFWLSNTGEARNALVDKETQKMIAASEFEDYYKSEDAAEWSFQLWTHNTEVALGAYAASAMGGALGIYLLFENALNAGAMAAVMHSSGKGSLFWGLIVPHGLLELTAIGISSGAGLHIMWTMLAPGDRTRGAALAEEGQRSIAIAMGIVVLFVAAGLTEAFVTPSSLPTWVRIAFGIVLEAAAIAWLFGRGKMAVEEGYTGLASTPR